MLNWRGKEFRNDDSDTILRELFSLEGFRNGQRKVISNVSQGKDVLAIMPTGSGKSLCYQIPAIGNSREDATVVISPLIALMRDQVNALQAKGVPAEALHSGLSDSDQEGILRRIGTNDVCLIYVSPERLKDQRFLDQISAIHVTRLIVDEAHCVSEWGPNFRPDYLRIRTFADRNNIDQIAAFTATASTPVSRDIRGSLRLKDPFEYSAPIDRPNLIYSVISADTEEDKRREILQLIEEKALGKEDTVIIYCATIEEVENLTEYLKSQSVDAEFYHGKMKPALREDREKEFMGNKRKVLVATNAFGMGIDKPNIRLVIHYNIPGNILSYLQETGRAGRDGEDSHCVLLYSKKDLVTQKYFLEKKTPPIAFLKDVYNALSRYKERARKALVDGTFEFNENEFLRGFTTWKYQGKKIDKAKAKRRTAKVEAALKALQQHGLIQRWPNYIKMAALGKDANIESIMDTIGDVRKEIAEVTLNQMVRYATSHQPNQQLLIDFLKEDLSAEEDE